MENDTIVYLIRRSEILNKSKLNNLNVEENSQSENERTLLSVQGEKKAKILSKVEELQNIDAVYSSNYIRALSTAKYIADNNGCIINIDKRLNERKVGNLDNFDINELHRMQSKDFNFKLKGGESLNDTKKRIVEAMKNILMFEQGNRVAVVSHSIVLTCLLSAWCDEGYNYDGDIILSYKDETLVDGKWDAPAVYKVIFDGMNVKSIEYLDLLKEENE